MSSFIETALPSRTVTSMPPSPSTLASPSTEIRRSCVMGVGLLAERRGVGVEGSEGAPDVAIDHVELSPPAGKRHGVRGLHGTEAPITAARKRWAYGSAAGVRHRAQTRRAVGD